MRIFRRRRPAITTKEEALAAARRATAQLRRSNEKARRYQAGKQENPVERMTPNQWAAGSGH